MKKHICILCALLLVFSLAGCGKSETPLYDRGMEVIGLLAEAMGSEDYLELLSAAEPLREIIASAAAGDYSAPKAVYSISFPGTALQSVAQIAEPMEVSEPLLDVVNHRLITTVMTQVNAMGGVETLAASTMCTVGKTFVSSEITSDVIYLYTFETGSPVAVTFTTGEDSTITATANVILFDEFPSGSAEEIREFFGSDAMEIADITRN